MLSKYFSILLVSIIVWVWYMHGTKPQCSNLTLEELIASPENRGNDFAGGHRGLLCKSGLEISGKKFAQSRCLKTGDIILFKSLNNLNSVFMFNYCTHVGIVVKDPILTNNEPYILEASGVKDLKWEKPRTKRGIYFMPLKRRVGGYLGWVFHKPISKPITADMRLKMINFVFYALKNMSYDYNPVGSCFRKKFTGEKCGNRTNCGELVFLSLINMGLLNSQLWNKAVFHHLRWMTNIKKLNNGYKYLDICEITSDTL